MCSAIPSQGEPYFVEEVWNGSNCSGDRERITAVSYPMLMEARSGTDEDTTKCHSSGTDVYGKMILNSSGCFWHAYSDSTCTTLSDSHQIMGKAGANCKA